MIADKTVGILLVEDNQYDANLAIRALKKHNLTDGLVHLKDGAEALDFIYGIGMYADRNISQRPKVILLDLKMPKVSGIEVLQKIKSNQSTKSIPVVVLTSSSEPPDIEKCYELGANSFIVKPVEFENFNQTISELGIYWATKNKLPYE
jgi:two-component system, response regulator